MTKQRRLICYGPFCYPKRIKHDRELLVTDYINHKHYCDHCHDYIKNKRINRHRLYQYIRRNARVSYPTPIMLHDLKKLQQFNYTYAGILNALKYAKVHSYKFNFKGQFFLRYVPYVYEVAQKWQYDQDQHDNLTINSLPSNNNIQQTSVDSKQFDESKKNPNYQIDETILN